MKKAFFVLPLILYFLTCGCDKNPVNSENGKNYTGPSKIIVYLIDEKGKPILEDYLNVDLEVKQGENIKYIHYFPQSDKNGKAIVDSLPAGKYKIDYYYTKRGTADSPNCQFSFIKEVILADKQLLELKINIPPKIDLKLKICYFDDKNIFQDNPKGIVDAQIKLIPGDFSAITDKYGYVSFKSIPLQGYTINMNHSGASLENGIRNFTYFNGEFIEQRLLTKNDKPQINILSPDDGSYHNYNGIIFYCDGSDFEDGALPDSSLVWESDISGKLGTGRELRINYITSGHHKITLKGTDTSGEISEKSIGIYITFSDESSYYPYPLNSYWNYTYNVPEITVSYPENQTEVWVLAGMKASTDEVNSRNCSLEYEIIRGNETFHCSYYIVDYYSTDGVNIYVEKTVEQLKVFGMGINNLVESIDIETEYSPDMLLIKNHTNLQSGDSYSSSTTASVTSVYYNKQFGTTNDTETRNVFTIYSVGTAEKLQTPAGVFDTIPLTVNINGTIKKWSLAKSAGIVKIDYTLSDIPVSATLTDTNIFSYYGNAKSVMADRNRKHLRLDLRENPGTSGRMYEIADILRKMCPR